jgi:lysophospholipase L1-like esterase
MNELQTIDFNGNTYDSFPDYVAREAIEALQSETDQNAPPEIKIESKADGYWDRYDKWFELETACAKRTNTIPVTEGDKLSYKGYSTDAIYSVIWFDENGAEIGNEKHDAKIVPVTLTAPAGASYAKFYSFDYVASVDDVVLEVSWVLCQGVETDGKDSASPLLGKKIVYDGDSICESRTGSTANNGGGYAKIIADVVGGTYENMAVSGAALTSTPADETYHSVVDSLEALPADGDLYCFEGGYNDFCRNVEIGTCDDADYTGSVDTNTICGAMEEIFRHCLSVLIGKPVCFVISHKCSNTQSANSTGKTFKEYRDAMVQVCEKYSIPYYDAFTKSGLNGWNKTQSDTYMTANANGTGDGCHPNKEGYKRYYVPQLIALFESMMPVNITQNDTQ